MLGLEAGRSPSWEGGAILGGFSDVCFVSGGGDGVSGALASHFDAGFGLSAVLYESWGQGTASSFSWVSHSL